eukprot:1829407-Prymnesium_polylepis.1
MMSVSPSPTRLVCSLNHASGSSISRVRRYLALCTRGLATELFGDEPLSRPDDHVTSPKKAVCPRE